MKNKYKFTGIAAKQSNKHTVVSFPASASDIFAIAKIDRAGRTDQGELFGFQRPQVSQHIREIRDYLSQSDSVLPNSVVLAFVEGIKIEYLDERVCEVEIDVEESKPGFIVDGQQRLTALEPLQERGFEVFVSAIICKDEEELRKQFILINNTRPLPKELIYELLPSVEGLPSRLSSRALGAHITTKLNYVRSEDDNFPPFFGEIRQHTNPSGSISSTSVQKIVMNSRSHGALREFAQREDFEEKAIDFINNFFGAMADLFPEAWIDKTPRNSRLKHSAGIISLGFVMEMAYSKFGAQSREEFRSVLECLRGKNVCAWTEGTWYFDVSDIRQWDRIQNTQPDIRALSNHLVKIVRDQNSNKVAHVISELTKGPIQSELME